MSLFGGIVAGCGPSSASEAAKTETSSSTNSTETKPVVDISNEKAPEPAATPGPVATIDKPKDGDEVAVIDTAKGKIIAMFYPGKAPKHVENFKTLAKAKFYDGTRFHRCIAGFMIQGGDPNSKDLKMEAAWGTGGNMKNGKEVNVPAEFNDVKHVRGVLSMARSQDPNSASSQFFIMQGDNAGLDGQYSAFGKAISGLEIVDEIVKTGDAGNNGKVEAKDAVVVKSITIVKWPVK